MKQQGAPRLIAIVDSERAPFEHWLARLEPLLAGARAGSVLLMLRDRQLPIRERVDMGRALRALTLAHAQRLSVNDRLDLAVLLEADAVHLPESGVSVSDARALGAQARLDWWISRACHAPADVARGGADGVLLSPVAEARKGRPALGVEGVRQARRELDGSPAGGVACRLYALGGVTAANTPGLLAAGADGVAVIGALLAPDAPLAFAGALDG